MKHEPDAERSKTQRYVLSLVQDLDHIFWSSLEDLDLVLGIIHEEQIQSECGKSHLGLVITIWKKIKTHLWDLSRRSNFAPASKLDTLFTSRQTRRRNPLKSIWNTRFEKQVLDLHWAAYHLDPNNTATAISSDSERDALHRFLLIISWNQIPMIKNEKYVDSSTLSSGDYTNFKLVLQSGMTSRTRNCFGVKLLLLRPSKWY